MSTFKVAPTIIQCDTFENFAKEYALGKDDLILTNEFIYDPFIKPLKLDCPVIFQEKYGAGEPSDEMIDGVLSEFGSFDPKRIIAVGGGTVIDIAKVMTLSGGASCADYFTRAVPLNKTRELYCVPTTCGTGSEVTNISIAELKKLHTKFGLADAALFPDYAVMIPDMLKTLPYKFFATSAIDALVHASESYLSPKADVCSELFSVKAMEMIIPGFMQIAAEGPEARMNKLSDFLVASNFAGIAFGNAGCAAVHAMAYPLGANYHVAHGETNQQMFMVVFKKYHEMNPTGKIAKLEKIYADLMNTTTDNIWDKVDELLDKVLTKPRLSGYGMKEEEIPVFAQSVLDNQQRLLANNYVELDFDTLCELYTARF